MFAGQVLRWLGVATIADLESNEHLIDVRRKMTQQQNLQLQISSQMTRLNNRLDHLLKNHDNKTKMELEASANAILGKSLPTRGGENEMSKGTKSTDATTCVSTGGANPLPEKSPKIILETTDELVAGEPCPMCGKMVGTSSTERVRKHRQKRRGGHADT